MVVSLAVIRVEDLPEMRDVFGPHIYQGVMNKIARGLEQAVPPRGMAARTGPTEFVLVFPELSRRKALAELATSLGTPPRFEFSVEGTEVVLVPELIVDTIAANETIVQAHDRLRARLQAAANSENARLEAMTKKRERLTKASALARQW